MDNAAQAEPSKRLDLQLLFVLACGVGLLFQMCMDVRSGHPALPTPFTPTHGWLNNAIAAWLFVISHAAMWPWSMLTMALLLAELRRHGLGERRWIIGVWIGAIVGDALIRLVLKLSV
jgi:hypothetical protein